MNTKKARPLTTTSDKPLIEQRLLTALKEACDAIEEHAKLAFIVNKKPVDEQEFHLAWAAEDPVDYWRWVSLKACAGVSRFKNTFCSQCGENVGQGDFGYSDCSSHP